VRLKAGPAHQLLQTAWISGIAARLNSRIFAPPPQAEALRPDMLEVHGRRKICRRKQLNVRELYHSRRKFETEDQWFTRKHFHTVGGTTPHSPLTTRTSSR